MDQPENSTATSRGSALPRFSKLPQPRSFRATSIDESSSILIPDTLVSPPSKPSRPMTIGSAPLGFNRSPADSLKPKKTTSISGSGYQRPPSAQSIRNLERTISDDDPGLESIGERSIIGRSDTSTPERASRRPRPSLSDRTTETLSHIPPSPSRRLSGFYGNDGPMSPPSRASSSLGYSRPSSRIGMSYSNVRPSSPSKKVGPTNTQSQLQQATPVRRTVSSGLTRAASVSHRNDLESYSKQTPSKLQRPNPSSVAKNDPNQAKKPLAGSKTVSARSTGLRSPVKGAFSSQLPNKLPTTNNTASRLQKPLPTNGSTAKGPLFTKPLRKASETKVAEAKDDVEPQKETESEKVPESSLSLRETIAKAKAARRSGVGVTNDASIPRSAEQNALPAATLEVDPATFEVLDSRFTNMLRKRINTARADGRLNIAAMSLTEIPKEVLRMYEFDANDTGNTAWYENVDLTRLNAADNEITELDETVFPDHDPEVPADDDAPVSIFAGLEQLDLHGNQLEEIPLGLRKLSKLMSLNLARNQITIPVFEILGTMQSLKELRLGKNSLQGTIPDGVCSLSNLEILEMQENGVSELPANIHKLSKLKMLNVADNKLTLLPFEQLAALPLVELMASRNRLSGVLISSAVSAMPTLQKLDVSHNALISFTDAEIDLPALRSLGISNNRISSLPDISRWHQLTVLSADENKISEIPQGFTTLLQLKTVDLSNNSLLTIDEKVGLMDNLVAMRIEDNPLRERKLLKMNTEDLKIELRSRFETATRSPATEAHIRPFMLRNTEKPQPTAWPVNSAGVLDRSNTKLRTIESTDVETLSKEHAVRTVIIHHNQLQHIPLPLEIFGTTLVTLDMSHNKLGKNEAYLTSSITLPFLQSLNLTSNGLTTLDPLVNHLSAPALGTLILPFNRLTKLPLLCKTFPALSTLLASNNAITQLDVEAVRGLRVLDVGSNEIEHLPPKLALLQGQLRTLMIGGNKFRVPGWGVLEKGTEEILSWCRKRIPAGEDGSAVDELD